MKTMQTIFYVISLALILGPIVATALATAGAITGTAAAAAVLSVFTMPIVGFTFFIVADSFDY